jgi:hypothetical protein
LGADQAIAERIAVRGRFEDWDMTTRSRSGMYVVLGLFVFGGLALAGLFLAPRGKMPTTMPATRESRLATDGQDEHR